MKRRSFLKKAGSWMGAAALGASLFSGTKDARAQTNRSAPSTNLRIVGESTNVTRKGVVRINAASLTEEARRAKIAGVVKQGMGSDARGLSTNTLVFFHGVCTNVFKMPNIGSNEVWRALTPFKHYLSYGTKLRAAWEAGNTNEIRRILERETLIPPAAWNAAEEQRQERIVKVIQETSKAPPAIKGEFRKIIPVAQPSKAKK